MLAEDFCALEDLSIGVRPTGTMRRTLQIATIAEDSEMVRLASVIFPCIS